MVRKLLAAILAVLAVSTSACRSDAKTAPPAVASSSSARSSFPVTITTDAGEITLAQAPSRIISLSPTATEMLFALGADGQVVAVDDQSNYPPGAPMTKLSGYTPNVEAIAGFSPDLVVIAIDPGGLVRSLRQLDIPVMTEPAAETLDDTYAQIEQLGEATGHPEAASALNEQMRSQIREIVDGMPHLGAPLSIYHELDDTFYSATSKTFIGQIYAMLGLANIADGAKGAGSGYPQLSAEYIISSDPDLIFLADTKCCKQSPATVSARPGWGGIAAVANGHVEVMDDDVASRWGPRVVGFMQEVADAAKAAGSVESPAA